jgi:hypothetical protein
VKGANLLALAFMTASEIEKRLPPIAADDVYVKAVRREREHLEFFGPPLPPDYEPPGLWDDRDAEGES